MDMMMFFEEPVIEAGELFVIVRSEIAVMKALNHRNFVNLYEVQYFMTKMYMLWISNAVLIRLTT